MTFPRLFPRLFVLLCAAGATGSVLQRRGCLFDWPASPDETCEMMATDWGITVDEFISYNPGARCPTLEHGVWYCVQWEGELPPPLPSTAVETISTQQPTTTQQATASTTTVGNGIETPQPTQPGLVSNCNRFYLVKQGDSCAGIASANGITQQQFQRWNSGIGSGCTGLWADTYACVAIIGSSPATATTKPTTTTITAPGNGVSTPIPTQAGMVGNCNKFYFVKAGDSCADIASKNGISTTLFQQWNPAVGQTCGGLWADTYTCVSIIGHTPTSPGNGIQTPSPTQPELVGNCNKFHLVVSGDRCSTIAAQYKIPVASFLEWNPKAGTGCAGLRQNAYACVSTIGSTPTNPGNGIQTPSPTQPDIVGNCNKFHLILSGDRCSTVSNKYGIPVTSFLEWNPKALSSCTGLKRDAYACVSVIGFTPTPTNPGNGITTPQPTQPDMVSNCDRFYFVQAGELCSAIASRHSISVADFLKWNPKAGSGCNGIWADAYACVRVVGHVPTPSNPGNGITTPSPTQPDIVTNCNKFHLVRSGERCSTVSAQYNLSVDLFLKWNPKAQSNCSGLKVNSYACVNVIGHTPATPTNPGNGIKTPEPIQSGMTKSCKTFHFVQPGQNCEAIQTRYKVTLANLVKWNPAIGSDCRGMWASSYLCIAVL